MLTGETFRWGPPPAFPTSINERYLGQGKPDEPLQPPSLRDGIQNNLPPQLRKRYSRQKPNRLLMAIYGLATFTSVAFGIKTGQWGNEQVSDLLTVSKPATQTTFGQPTSLRTDKLETKLPGKLSILDIQGLSSTTSGMVKSSPSLSRLVITYHNYLEQKRQARERVGLGELLDFAITQADQAIEQESPENTNRLIEAPRSALIGLNAILTLSAQDLREIGVKNIPQGDQAFWGHQGVAMTVLPRISGEDTPEAERADHDLINQELSPRVTGADRLRHLIAAATLAYNYRFLKYAGLEDQINSVKGVALAAKLFGQGDVAQEAAVFTWIPALGYEILALRLPEDRFIPWLPHKPASEGLMEDRFANDVVADSDGIALAQALFENAQAGQSWREVVLRLSDRRYQEPRVHSIWYLFFQSAARTQENSAFNPFQASRMASQ